ncbi:MAG: hypothetical protein NT069_10320 [Planctomycetota bacterium]|nr:hypothetical protein [Planctomycetota bacterium]
MSQAPVHEIRFGLVKCRIWRNMTKSGQRHHVTVCRLYRNGDVWKESLNLGRDDLPLAVKALDMAHTWIYLHSGSVEAVDEE